MPFLWLRFALLLYGLGVIYSIFAGMRKQEWLGRVLPLAIFAGAIFHFVSIIEFAGLTGSLAPASPSAAESQLAFIIVFFFLAFWLKYHTPTPGLLVFPIVFLLVLAAVAGQGRGQFSSPLLRTGWIAVHVTLIFLGYAALVFSFVASLLYLLQERRLKSKSSAEVLGRMPALEVIDEIGYRSLLVGFPFMTLGLLAGAVVAQVDFGPAFFRDPKIILSVLLWLVYLVLLFTRWNAGWRGRRAAFLSTFAFVAAIGTWAANYVSVSHKFLGP
jgi:ABC-type uncharacterized transport system permease subunit